MPAVQVDGLVKTYGDGTQAVKGISFSVEEGEFFGFLGPNGAGKSTTIKILTTLLKKTSGSASVAGLNIGHDDQKTRKLIGSRCRTPLLMRISRDVRTSFFKAIFNRCTEKN